MVDPLHPFHLSLFLVFSSFDQFEMAQGKSLKPRNKTKRNKKARAKQAKRVTKVAGKKSTKSKRGQRKIAAQIQRKKLTGVINNHIEQVMIERIHESRGGGGSVLKILTKQDDKLAKTEAKKKKMHG